MGNKPECVILFHNGTSLLRNGKIKSLIHSLSTKRMSNTLHFLCYFRILNGSVLLYVLLMDLIQFILNSSIARGTKLMLGFTISILLNKSLSFAILDTFQQGLLKANNALEYTGSASPYRDSLTKFFFFRKEKMVS
jgi:hypothetical protein